MPLKTYKFRNLIFRSASWEIEIKETMFESKNKNGLKTDFDAKRTVNLLFKQVGNLKENTRARKISSFTDVHSFFLSPCPLTIYDTIITLLATWVDDMYFMRSRKKCACLTHNWALFMAMQIASRINCNTTGNK